MSYKYKVVTIGGTFGHFHKGHRAILEKAFAFSEKVVIGVTSDVFARKARNGSNFKGLALEKGFVVRRMGVERFLREEGLNKRAKIVKIEDMFGPLKEQGARLPARQAKSKEQSNFGKIQAMVVTKETRRNAETINRWRREHGLDELDLVEVEMVLAEDGRPISSRRIRDGEINREGIVYGMHKLWGRLPRELREELRRPLGKIIRSEIDDKGVLVESKRVKKSKNQNISLQFQKYRTSNFSPPIITIGDISTKRLIENGIKPEVAVFDLKVMREKVFDGPEDIGVGGDYQLIKIKNPAGQVTKELHNFFSQFYNHVVLKLRKSKGNQDVKKHVGVSHFDNHVVIEVRKRLKKVALWIEGEEDLSALPAILFAPLQSIVVYGQPRYQTYLASRSASSPARGVGTGQAPLSEESRGGLIVVEVSEEKKEKVYKILQKFHTSD